MPCASLFRSLRSTLSECHYDVVTSVVGKFHQWGWIVAWLSIGTLLLEPLCAFKAGALLVFNFAKKFTFFGLNPETLTQMQIEKGRAVLFIHGYLHNQTAWLRTAKKCQREGIAAFTVDLPSAPYSAKDKEVLEKKWAEIEALYAAAGVKDFQISVVGHSRGAGLAKQMALKPECWSIDEDHSILYSPYCDSPSRENQRGHLGNVVLLGMNSYFNDGGMLSLELSQAEASAHVFQGIRDYIVEEYPPKTSSKCKNYFFNTGHLGLFFSRDVERKMISLIS